MRVRPMFLAVPTALVAVVGMALRTGVLTSLAGAVGIAATILFLIQVNRADGNLSGVDAGTWVDPGGESRYVRVRLAPESRENAADVARIPLILPGGPNGPTVVPLGQVARIDKSVGPAQITHLDRRRVITVGANIHGGPTLISSSNSASAGPRVR